MKKKIWGAGCIIAALIAAPMYGASKGVAVRADEYEPQAGDVAINEENFPDEYFREWISENLDATPDGVLTKSEISLVTRIDCKDSHIADLTGVKFFTNLESLDCRNNVIEELDLSGMPYLENFLAGYNVLSKIDASNCKKLTFWGINYGYGNKMSVEDTMWNCTDKTGIYAYSYYYGNPLKSVDFSGCISLEVFVNTNDTLTEADFSGCTALKKINLTNKQIESINITGCSNLEEVHLAENEMQTLDLTGCQKLRILELYSNKFVTIDLTPCPNLEELNINANQLKNIDVSSNKLLRQLVCKENQLVSLDVSNHAMLDDFSCRFNNIKTLNLSGCKKLTDLSYIHEDNPLESLDLSDCISLNEFSINDTPLISVDLSRCSGLVRVDLSNNQLEEISLDGCDHLQELNVYNNNLEDLDISTCKRLETLDCRLNYLTKKPSASNLTVKFDPQKILEAPSGFKVETVSEESVTLAWDDAGEDIHYELFRSDSKDDGYISIYSADRCTSYTDEDLNPNTTYYYKLRLWISVDRIVIESPFSDTLEAKTKALPTPTPTETPSPTPNPVTPTPTPVVKKTGIKIDEEHFPDKAFRKYVSESIDKDSNGLLSQDEITITDFMDVSEQGIQSIKGIEYFADLKWLGCEHNSISTIDVSKNAKLTSLWCGDNKITGLVINPNLMYLECNDNLLTSLDVSKNKELDVLVAHHNKLASLDISNCKVKGVVDDDYLEFVEKEDFYAYIDPEKNEYYLSFDKTTKIIGANVPVPSTGSIADFVERLYTVALGRPSEKEGKEYWVKEITNGNKTGADCGLFFLTSEEFNNRGLSIENFVETLYQTFFGRASEPNGKAYWVGELKSGRKSRADVIWGFIDSKEWCNICADYGVKSGAPTAKAEHASQNAIDFATRLYTCCLGRASEEGGLKYWSLALTNLEQTGCSAAKLFFTSEEFVKFKLKDDEYVRRLYTTFMGREPAKDEIAYWIGEIKKGSQTRYSIMQFFGQSPEFTNICKKYGIDRGTI
ncbi:MAG: DUF4214 domain-containing protein [Clostridiales bacterium]|nr:DUF4214 domain-containing protein [Clostridiales bacterium]